jgi:dUTP pyrophosphatase
MKVKITRVDSSSKDIPLPAYVTEGAAGMDLFAAVRRRVVLRSGETALIPTGIAIELPAGYEAQIRPRSGLAAKYNVGILNAPGTVDSDYRGEIKVILTNFGKKNFTVKRGDRIAQMVVSRYVRIEWNRVTQLRISRRGSGGFGHTGT